MGAWVADEFPEHLTVTVLRDPVERTISHLRQIAALRETPDDLEEIYADPLWHDRLADHQTQVFSSTRDAYLAQETNGARYGVDATAPAPDGGRPRMWAAFATAIGRPRVIDATTYAEAARRLDRIDEVGVTPRLDLLAARLSARIGVELPAVRRVNVRDGEVVVSPELVERIEADCTWDRKLYERALARQAE